MTGFDVNELDGLLAIPDDEKADAVPPLPEVATQPPPPPAPSPAEETAIRERLEGLGYI